MTANEVDFAFLPVTSFASPCGPLRDNLPSSYHRGD
jgi:hypothetical protein